MHPPLPDQTLKGASRVISVQLWAPVVNLADEEDERSARGKWKRTQYALRGRRRRSVKRGWMGSEQWYRSSVDEVLRWIAAVLVTIIYMHCEAQRKAC